MKHTLIGRDGRWPNAHALKTYLRHFSKDEPHARDVATHEAAHAVVAHTLGCLTAFVTARLSAAEGRGHHRFDSGRMRSFSPEARVQIALAGRGADERLERFGPLRYDIQQGDDMTALAGALAATDSDVDRCGAALLTALETTRDIVADHWSAVLKVADELTARDLDGSAIVQLLGDVPPCPWPATHTFGDSFISIEIGEMRAVASVFLARARSLPYGMAFVPSDRGPGRDLMWRASDGHIQIEPFANQTKG